MALRQGGDKSLLARLDFENAQYGHSHLIHIYLLGKRQL